jgi:hypothetical protein
MLDTGATCSPHTRMPGSPAATAFRHARLEPDEAELRALTAAAGFGEKPEHFVRLVLPELLVADGPADGASWAWLQSSSAGYRFYEALGFETIERWPCWVRV